MTYVTVTSTDHDLETVKPKKVPYKQVLQVFLLSFLYQKCCEMLWTDFFFNGQQRGESQKFRCLWNSGGFRGRKYHSKGSLRIPEKMRVHWKTTSIIFKQYSVIGCIQCKIGEFINVSMHRIVLYDRIASLACLLFHKSMTQFVILAIIHSCLNYASCLLIWYDVSPYLGLQTPGFWSPKYPLMSTAL